MKPQFQVVTALCLGLMVLSYPVSFVAAQAAPQQETDKKPEDKITEISFRQACLCAGDGFITIILKADDPEPIRIGYFSQIARWLEMQNFFELKDHYFNELDLGSSECQHKFTVVRGNKKKTVTCDCTGAPVELWALQMVLLRAADEIEKAQLREQRRKQGVRGTLENYVPVPSIATNSNFRRLSFVPEPYQTRIEMVDTSINENGIFHADLMPGSYRIILEFPELGKPPVKVSGPLITIEPEKFLSLTLDAKQFDPKSPKREDRNTK